MASNTGASNPECILLLYEVCMPQTSTGAVNCIQTFFLHQKVKCFNGQKYQMKWLSVMTAFYILRETGEGREREREKNTHTTHMYLPNTNTCICPNTHNVFATTRTRTHTHTHTHNLPHLKTHTDMHTHTLIFYDKPFGAFPFFLSSGSRGRGLFSWDKEDSLKSECKLVNTLDELK